MTSILSAYALSDAPIARNYWAEAVPDSALERPALAEDIEADVVVVGAGFTGLNAALVLAEAGRRVVVLDRRFPGWGASGRNGGFCCLGGTRASDAALDRRHGPGAADEVRAAEIASVAHVAGLIDRFGWDVDRHSEGETVLAHSAAAARRMARKDGFMPPDEMAAHGMRIALHGGLTEHPGFALHPRKYLKGLLDAVEAAQGRVFGNSEVQTISSVADGWRVETADGHIRAGRMILATNAYGGDRFVEWMRGRTLPAQSSIIASRKMTGDELTAQGWTSHQMAYEKRRLLHYFHLTPDRRMVFGARGGLISASWSEQRIVRKLRHDFDRLFPEWRGVDTPWHWSGMVCATSSLTPYCGPVPGMDGVTSAFGYHGNGVAMGSYCGALAGQIALGLTPQRPYPRAFRTPPARFPFGRWRRVLLAAEYAWARLTGY